MVKIGFFPALLPLGFNDMRVIGFYLMSPIELFLPGILQLLFSTIPFGE